MAQETFTPQKDPPEGSREVIDRELARQAAKEASASKQQGSGAPAPGVSERPGDQADPGTPGTGENVCPECGGTGKVNGHPCDQCRGTGKVVTGIGGG
jgi:DnaJ-class molecular chaperone